MAGEGQKKRGTSIRLDDDLIEDLDRLARELRISRAAVLRLLAYRALQAGLVSLDRVPA